MNAKIRYGLSAAVLALIAAGAPAPDILDQFLDEKEGNHTTAYRDGAGTVGIGAHTHSVAIGSHGHTITVNAAGNAENTVKNIAFNYIVRLA
ncbi:phage tail protein [Escherichia coli]|nr:phage tail protein [Escherichia coli]